MLKKGSCALMALILCAMAGCGVNVTNAPGASSSAGSTPTDSAPSATSSAKPAADGASVTLQVVDSSDSTKARREAYNAQFMEENPGITVEYTTLAGDQFKTTINSAIKAGTAPDLFPIPGGMKLSTVVAENWYQPMDSYLDDAFLGGFSQGSLNEGITTLDGKIYVLPEAANIINTLIFYNKTVMKQAGLDPESPPKTRTEFIDACKKIAEAGKGQYYAMIEGGKQTNRLEIMVRALSSQGGGKSNDIGVISLVDGKNVLNSAPMIEALDFLDTLVKDGSFHPDTVNLTAPEARAMFAQNQAAFLMQGSWCISTWRKDNPDLDFGVMAPPAPDSGLKGGLPYIGAQPWMGISAGCKNPELAAKYLKGLYSVDYQSKLVEDGGFVSVLGEVNDGNMKDPIMLDYYNLNKEAGKLAPDPIVGNPQAAQVYAKVTDISPNLGQIVQGVLSGSLPDYKGQVDILAQNSQTEWERAIEAAKAAGAAVSKDDFEFKNWDPMKDYTAQDYASR